MGTPSIIIDKTDLAEIVAKSLEQDHRNELAEKVCKLLRQEWGDLFTDEDTVKIYDFCHEEVDNVSYPFSDDDIQYVAGVICWIVYE